MKKTDKIKVDRQEDESVTLSSLDDDTRDDLLLDAEAIAIDTDEVKTIKAEEDVESEAGTKVKPSGRDAENLRLKTAKKQTHKKRKKKADDRAGQLKKLKTADYLELLFE